MNSPDAVPRACPESEPRFDVTVQVPADCDLSAVLKRLVQTRAMVPEKAEKLIAQLRLKPQARSSSGVTRTQADKAVRKLGAAGLTVVLAAAEPLPQGPQATQEAVPELAPEATAELAAEPAVEPAAALALVATLVVDPVPQDPAVEAPVPPTPVPVPVPLPEWARPSQSFGMRPPAPITQPMVFAAAAARSAQTQQAASRHAVPTGRRSSAHATVRKASGAPWVMLALAGLAFLAGWWAPGLLREPLGSAPATASSAWLDPAASRAEPIDTVLTRLDAAVVPDPTPAAGASAIPVGLLAESGRGGFAKLGAGTASVRRPPLPDDARVRWLASLAESLSEIGQGARAEEALSALAPWRNSADPALSTRVRRADLLVQAWDLQQVGQAPVRPRVEALNASLLALADPADRADALGDVAAVLARHASLPAALAQSFLSQAEDTLKLIIDPVRRLTSTNHWTVNRGEVMLAEVRREAHAGRAVGAKAVANRLAGLPTAGLSEIAQAHLLALRVCAERMVGTPASVRTLFTAAIQRVEKLTDPLAQVHALRLMALDMGAANATLLGDAVYRITARVDTLEGQTRADVLTELSLLWADSGRADALVLLNARALHSPGLAPEVSRQLEIDLLMGGELAQALAHHRAGEFAQAEAGLRSVASHLL